jgi:hypothetical protein
MHRIALQKPAPHSLTPSRAAFTGPAALRRISLTFRSIVPGFEDAMANRVHDHAGLVQGQGGAPGSAAGP